MNRKFDKPDNQTNLTSFSNSILPTIAVRADTPPALTTDSLSFDIFKLDFRVGQGLREFGHTIFCYRSPCDLEIF